MKKYNWKKAAAWICTLTLLTGTLSLSSFGEIGPGAALSETIAGTVAAAAEAVDSVVGTVTDTVGDVFMRGPSAASASDTKKASGNDASPSVATDPDASQFDADGILIDGIALIDDVATPSELRLMRAPLLGAPLISVTEDRERFFMALMDACDAWNNKSEADRGTTIPVMDLAQYGVPAATEAEVNAVLEEFLTGNPKYSFISDTVSAFSLETVKDPEDNEISVIDEMTLKQARAPEKDLEGFFRALAEPCKNWSGGDITGVTVTGLGKFGVAVENVSDADEIFETFINAYPEYFFLSHSRPDYETVPMQNPEDGMPDVDVIDSVTLKVLKVGSGDISNFQNKIEAITAGIPSGADRKLKALYLHDWLCANCVYWSELDESTDYAEDKKIGYSAYGALINGQASCQGYAMAYQCLLNEAGFEDASHIVWDWNHSWNLVNIGSGSSENWLHVDCTQDDPDSMYAAYFDHRYFLTSSEGTFAAYYHESWALDTGDTVPEAVEKGVISEGTEISDAKDGNIWNRVIGTIPVIGSRWFYTDSEDSETIWSGYTQIRFYDISDGKSVLFSKDAVPGRWDVDDSYYSYYNINY
ncbi:MAG: hypothetical protein J6P32_02265, partial [Stomatobaculum sp.]|nr:hypothetical protein [Stomatobaculum sp.]